VPYQNVSSVWLLNMSNTHEQCLDHTTLQNSEQEWIIMDYFCSYSIPIFLLYYRVYKGKGKSF
jgi:hypothetical protein